MTPSIDHLEMLSRCLSTDDQLPVTLRQWLHDCLSRWQSGESLPDAFGVSDSVAERIVRRDKALRDYAELLPGGLWTKCETIAKAVQRNHMAMRKNAVIAQIEAIHPLPKTTRGIYNLLKNKDI